MAKKRPAKKQPAKRKAARPGKRRPAKKSAGSQFKQFSTIFGGLLQKVHREGPDSKSIQDRYPPDVYAKAEEFCANLTQQAFENVAASKKSRQDKRVMEDLHMEMLMESDRGCVLIASAAVEDHIKAIVEYLLCSGDESEAKAGKSLISGFTAPLGTAWSREVLLHALGVIDEGEAAAFKAVRDLRNIYAHKPIPATLTESHVNSIMRHLDEVERAKVDIMGAQIGGFMEAMGQHEQAPFGLRLAPTTSRMRFMLCVRLLINRLSEELNFQKRQDVAYGKIAAKVLDEDFPHLKKSSQPKSSRPAKSEAQKKATIRASKGKRSQRS